MPAIQPPPPGKAFRPPWVKEGPPALPMPSSAPWMRSRELRASRDDGQTTAVSQELQAARDRLNAVEPSAPAAQPANPAPGVRRLSKITIIPAAPAENGKQPVRREVNSKPSEAPATRERRAEQTSKPKETPKPKEAPKPNVPRERNVEVKSAPIEEKRNVPPPPPPAPAMPPAPPLPPPLSGLGETNPAKLEKIEALRSRPRKRPDWGVMMKEIETKRKLNHVVCNDRSSPLLATPIKVKEQFMYESEKPNIHNKLLDQIQSGVSLKRVKTNDRSRPILDGLRKFRRQMTIEEQIQKSEHDEPVTVEQDELDDIDKVRDDLQSTKQMLALELRNKEQLERDNKKLMARLLNLEVELEKERNSKQSEQTPQTQRIEEEKESRKLKGQLLESQRNAEEMENKYHETAGQLDLTKGELEDLQRKNQILERRLANYTNRDSDQPLVKQASSKKLSTAKSNTAIDTQQANKPEEEEEEESEYEEETETETEDESSDEEDKEALQAKRTARELKLLNTKLVSFKDKEELAKKERSSLREQLKKLNAMLKEEKKKYKVLQKDVDSMACSMANVLKEYDEEDEEEENEEVESESESESDSEESDDESEGDLAPDSSSDAKKQNLTNRSKRHENLFNVLKKGNYMLKANVDRLKDDLFKQKEMAITLQEDLNSVLAELG